LARKTYIKEWFIRQMKELVAPEEEILTHKGRPLPDELLKRAKQDGFADRYLAKVLGVAESEIREQRRRTGVVEAWDAVPVSANPRKVMVLGGGPNRIGQGIEFDYCCVHTAFALRDEGYESEMVNCNPETVSTDYDTFNMLPEVDPLLGPEMRSTGEVLGMANSFGEAFFKAQEATQVPLPLTGGVLITVADHDKMAVVEAARQFDRLGFRIVATRGTAATLARFGINADAVDKLQEGRPNIVDLIMNREVSLVINTPAGKESQYDDSYIRKNAIKYKIPYITTLAGAVAAAKGIAARRPAGESTVKPLQRYHAEIN
jgi:hypothetical protein